MTDQSFGLALTELGWKPFFSEQVAAEEHCRCAVARVMSVHRGTVVILGDGLEETIPSRIATSAGQEDRPTVGDWLLVDRDSRTIVRLLERTSIFKRPAPADEQRIQLIAANVDTLFIVTSCDQDFNIARIERYLVLAREAGVRPVIILTKADLAPAPEQFVEAARALHPELPVELINGRDPSDVVRLAAYCGLGETVALVGSSGVGKSTLVNTLTGSDSATQSVRVSDGKGLHTTTVREMHRLRSGLNGGGWLVDTPGMRELEMSEVSSGVAEVFDDITALVRDCRFGNCTHADEPGCAIRAALADGGIEPVRFERWRKLSSEDEGNTRSAVARRNRPTRPGRRK